MDRIFGKTLSCHPSVRDARANTEYEQSSTTAPTKFKLMVRKDNKLQRDVHNDAKLVTLVFDVSSQMTVKYDESP